jgi:hypothetical protein
MTPRLAIVLLAGALLVGCGSGGSSKAEPDPPTVEEQLGFSQAGDPAAQAKVEEQIAACMKQQGFEYTPVDPVARQAALTGRSGISGDEFDKQFGYGIATLYGRATPQSDPNARIRANLSPANQRAYDRALTGGDPGQTFFRAADTGDFSRLGGCTKRAADALFGGSKLLDVLQRKLDELDEAVLEDQRMVRAREAWRRCMRDRTGQAFEDSEAVELEVQRRLAEIVGPLPEGESAPGEFAALTPEGPIDEAALSRLRRLELKLADADVGCEEKHIAPVEDTVQQEKEKQFREDNAELLRRISSTQRRRP